MGTASHKGALEGSPTAAYQCVSRPGQCKFEWQCGPLCPCVLPHEAGRKYSTAQEQGDVAEAERRQAIWRYTKLRRRDRRGRWLPAKRRH